MGDAAANKPKQGSLNKRLATIALAGATSIGGFFAAKDYRQAAQPYTNWAQKLETDKQELEDKKLVDQSNALQEEFSASEWQRLMHDYPESSEANSWKINSKVAQDVAQDYHNRIAEEEKQIATLQPSLENAQHESNKDARVAGGALAAAILGTATGLGALHKRTWLKAVHRLSKKAAGEGETAYYNFARSVDAYDAMEAIMNELESMGFNFNKATLDPLDRHKKFPIMYGKDKRHALGFIDYTNINLPGFDNHNTLIVQTWPSQVLLKHGNKRLGNDLYDMAPYLQRVVHENATEHNGVLSAKALSKTR